MRFTSGHKEKEAYTEEELVKLCRQGDNEARKQLYERYGGRLFAICMRYVGNRDEAEDVLHDGFLKLFASFDKFDWKGEGSLPAWMGRVMANEALQYLRNKKQNALDQSVEFDDAPQVADVPDVQEVSRIPHEVLMRFIEELPDGYRTVFNLYVFEKKSHIEIAEILGIKQKSSSSQLTRAKALLMAKIKDWQKREM